MATTEEIPFGGDDAVPNCGNCAFAQATKMTKHDIKVFACRRFPPHQTGRQQTPELYPYPMVAEPEWCGEHQPKLKEHEIETEKQSPESRDGQASGGGLQGGPAHNGPGAGSPGYSGMPGPGDGAAPIVKPEGSLVDRENPAGDESREPSEPGE